MDFALDAKVASGYEFGWAFVAEIAGGGGDNSLEIFEGFGGGKHVLKSNC